MRVIVIGGIAAGMSAAAKFRRLDKDAEIKVYEKTPIVSFGACGLPYFVGGFFDNENQMIARSPEKFKESGIDISVEHQVIAVDPVNKKIKVKDLKTDNVFEDSYDKLMIATGASAIIPPIKNFNIDNVHTLKSMEDGKILREKMKDNSIKKVAIIGAGFIGLEAVEAAREYNKEISVFQLEDRILKEVFDKEVTSILEEELKNKGVNLFLNSKVVEFKGDSKVNKVVTENEEIEADLVVLATGVKPNTEFLKDTGIKMLKNGAIVVDKQGKTSIEDIYSAGDCATVTHLLKPEPTYIPLATVANKFGRIVGENLGGKNMEYEGSLGSACIKVLDIEAGRTGITEEEATKLGLNFKTVFVTDKNQTDYYPGQEEISIKLIYNADTKVILGAQVVGKKDAVQRTNALAVAIYAKVTTEQLGMMDFCYSPPFARTWDVLNRVGNVAK
ncbi:CoA-disulfide reductase [[Clostridium] colinum]|uniref:CoA-disulfide reductase n=1 Tax=[Clostridium] colinum TaxID=36835 RepID=UPI002024FB26|nr:CoA-disulfide reductase [[Clostridium] colinum]